MIINDLNGRNDDIKSEEGSTQGDVTAMGMYAVGTRQLINKLSKQVWYADDSASAGKILEMRKWWDELSRVGPKYGYYPNAIKTIMIVKDPNILDHAKQVFAGTDITIGTEGERHLGAAIGNLSFKEEYVKKKIDKWIQDVAQLSEIAKSEPQMQGTQRLCV